MKTGKGKEFTVAIGVGVAATVAVVSAIQIVLKMNTSEAGTGKLIKQSSSQRCYHTVLRTRACARLFIY